jgi:RNA recognition motif. (a.k.a. RRM, RBD, or RNP domain)
MASSTDRIYVCF